MIIRVISSTSALDVDGLVPLPPGRYEVQQRENRPPHIRRLHAVMDVLLNTFYVGQTVEVAFRPDWAAQSFEATVEILEL